MKAKSELPAAMVLSGHLRSAPKQREMNDMALALTRSLGRRGVRVYRFHPNKSLIDLASR